MDYDRLTPGAQILDPAQPLHQADHTAWLLTVLLQPGWGPEHVRVHVWEYPVTAWGQRALVCAVTCDN